MSPSACVRVAPFKSAINLDLYAAPRSALAPTSAQSAKLVRALHGQFVNWGSDQLIAPLSELLSLGLGANARVRFPVI